MKNIVKCSYCRQILIAELFDSHKCKGVPWKTSKNIPVSSYFDCSTDEKQQIVGVGLDGVRYWLVVKKREAVPVSTDFTHDDENNRQLHST